MESEPKKEKKRKKKKKKKKKQKLMLNENIEESWKIGFSSPRKTSNDTGAQSPQSNLFPYAARKKRVWLHSWWPVPEPSSRPKQGSGHPMPAPHEVNLEFDPDSYRHRAGEKSRMRLSTRAGTEAIVRALTSANETNPSYTFIILVQS